MPKIELTRLSKKLFLALAIASTASLNAQQPAKQSKWSKANAVLKLDHVIAGIDRLTLRSCDFCFDGGSLVFSFAQRPEWPVEFPFFCQILKLFLSVRMDSKASLFPLTTTLHGLP